MSETSLHMIAYYCIFYFIDDGQIRLTNLTKGLLEVCYEGQWGYVCDDGWSEINGDVACSTLGSYISTSFTSFYSSDLNYNLNQINCTGGELNLLDCSYSVYTPNSCDSYGHVNIICQFGKLRMYMFIN